MVMTTVGSEDEAQALAQALVETRLAACVQISPISSVYRWDAKVEQAREQLLFCKIAERDFATVEAAICERHSYDVPEIVMLPITAGHAPYLAWIGAETARP